jgi:DNA ligase-1
MLGLTVHYHRGGIYLPEQGLWLDPRERITGGELAFVSHAHTDHIGKHREVVTTAPTARFMRARLRCERREHLLAFGEPRDFAGYGRPFRLTLLPAGHIAGSAMAFIETSGHTLLYTGDFNNRPSRTAEPCAPIRADILVMEATFGRPEYRFPSAADVWADAQAFCTATLAQDTTPLLLGYSLGKAQELLQNLGGIGVLFALHESAFQLTRLHEEFGHRFPPFEEFSPYSARGKVIVWPVAARHPPELPGVGHTRSAVFTGWAMDSRCRFRYGTDAAFPISDHADFPGLLAFVRQVAPKQVFTLHGFASDFAQTLREHGQDALALSEPDQLRLALFPAPKLA